MNMNIITSCNILHATPLSTFASIAPEAVNFIQAN